MQRGSGFGLESGGANLIPLSLLCADEFPESLLILNLTGNSCTNQDGYR